jgi:hypothetical protein
MVVILIIGVPRSLWIRIASGEEAECQAIEQVTGHKIRLFQET